MAKRTKPQHGDRVVNTTTGETGTIIDVHDGSRGRRKTSTNAEVHYSVLPDAGLRETTVWAAAEAEWSFPVPGCQRCGQRGHRPMACPNGATS